MNSSLFRLSLFKLLSALASGALYAFANVGFGYWPLAFFCFVPLLFALERGQSVRSGALLGLACGAMLYFVGYSWLLALTDGFVSGGALTSIGMWASYGFFVALHFLAFGVGFVVLRKLGVILPLAAVLSILVVESLQLNLFPFFLGASLIHSLNFAQAADLGGVYLLSALVMFVNASLVAVVLRFSRRSVGAAVYLALIALTVGFLHYYGANQNSMRSQHLSSVGASGEDENRLDGNALEVGIIQSDLYGISQAEQRTLAHAHHLNLSRELLDSGQVDLLVWPEAAYGKGLRGSLPLDGQLIQQELTTPILFGATRFVERGGQSRAANSVFLVDETRKISGVYSKNRLIPFSEYLPFESILAEHEDSVKKVFPEYQRFVPGDSLDALVLAGRKISTPICYEAVMPDLVRQMVLQNHSELLVSVANDSWFGKSKEPYIHLAMARLRAIEHRRWFVRAANSGISAVINPQGRVVNSVPVGEEGVRVSTVQWRTGLTLYTSFGNWPSLFVLVLAFFNLLVMRVNGFSAYRRSSASLV